MRIARRLTLALFAASLVVAYACSDSSSTDETGDAGSSGTSDGALPPDAGFDANQDASTASDARSDALAPSRYAAAVLADGPIVYYRFDETTGDVARSSADAGGTSYDLGFTGLGIARGMPSLLPSDPNPSFGLDAGSHLRREGSTGTILTAMTLEAWVRPEHPASLATVISTIGNGRDPGFSLFIRDGDAGAITLAFHTYGALSSSIEVPFDGKAHHVAAVFADGNVTFFLDGRSEVVPSPPVPPDASYAVGNLAVGRFFGIDQGPFAGGIDELAIYPVALPVARLEAHRQAAIAP